MARNKFLTTIAGLLTNFSNRRKSQINPPTSEGYVHRQKSDGENDLTRYLTKYLKNFRNFYQSLLPSAERQNRQNSSRRWRRLMQHKLGKSFINLLQTIGQLGRYLSVPAFYRLWRNFFVAYRQRTQAGFVLPVTMLMVVVMLLVVTSLMFRAFQRSEQVIGDYQLQQVKNTSTPAIERAKAKIQLLLAPEAETEGAYYSQKSGIPSESEMEELLAGDAAYTWTGETRLTPANLGITVTPDGGKIAAWKFQSDSDGDGTNDTITAYAILVRSARKVGNKTKTIDHRLAESNPATHEVIPDNDPDNDRSKLFVVSNGPIAATSSGSTSCQPKYQSETTGASKTDAEGWFQMGGGDAVLKKNIQVYAVSLPIDNKGNLSNPVISTAQYQQDRSADRGNKWGAWFRTDIEINPAANFDWNGAIHTEGSLYIMGQKDFNGKLISEKESCFLNPKQNSDITIGGHLVNSEMTRNQTSSGAVKFELYPDANLFPVTNATDSSKYTGSPIDLSINPQAVLLQNKSVARGGEGFWENQVNSSWVNSDLATKRVSILQSGQAPPYIDDTYRADNRYGPKVGYSSKVTTPECVLGKAVGGSGCNTVTPSVEQVIRNEPPDPVLQPDDYGLDGYWERRARGQGTRIIVGQRLELGNAFGWVQDLSSPPNDIITETEDKKRGDDPLNPPRNPIANTNMNSRRHELRQRRTQYDNLAAVQSTLVYHYTDTSKGYDPVAAVATTVHPGTENTLKESAKFETIAFKDKTGTEQKPIAIDFFNGYGTNGWEFAPPTVTSTSLSSTAPLGKALRNLAYFAGDPDGAFPPKQEAGKVHPLPQLTMWGNFSNLRRIFDQNTSITLPKAGTPGNISLADLTTLQTASANLGMLAYNIDYLQSYDYANNQTYGLGGGIAKLGEALWKLQDQDSTNGEVIDLAAIPSPAAINYNLPPDAYIAALERDKDPTKLNITDDVIKLARLVMTKEQIERDRTYGFNVSADNHPNNSSTYNPTDGIATWVNSTVQINSACDISATSGNNYFGLGTPTADTEQQFIGLSRLCSNKPKFPSLYYIFPKVNHGHAGTGDHAQPNDEPYIRDADITTINSGSDRYQALSNADIATIKINPKKADLTDWVLPQSTTTVTNTQAAPNDSQREVIQIVNGTNSTNRRVAIKDSALFNGREEMSVRVLNLDVDMLRSVSPPNDNTETWLPKSGIMYVFREDAVREDAIARPGGSQMNASTPTDPTLDANGMSTKAIDYYADPDRRPYGFRLKNGQDLRRKPGGSLNKSILRGLTLVSDNPVYIQGDFNLHTSNGSDTLTELTGPSTKRVVDSNFANPEVDYWRPTEVLGDAITVISNNFCDGSIQEGYLNTGPMTTVIDDANTQKKYGCLVNGPQRTSYSNQNRPRIKLQAKIDNKTYDWALANPWEPYPNGNSPKSPIVINKNGEVLMNEVIDPAIAPYTRNVIPYNQQYNAFSDRDFNASSSYIGIAIDTKANLTMVNGVVPARTNQGNGGLINFPRMLENWRVDGGSQDKTLTIRGSFMQLNFSQYATGPFDQDAWEPGIASDSNERIFYYLRPKREWGYDVGLQYLPAGPVARRILVPGNERSEFYREPKGDDPYICLLRTALGFACN